MIAYEPVWAIGTGLTPTVSDVEEAHAFMRRELVSRFGAEGGKMRILYEVPSSLRMRKNSWALPMSTAP